MTLASYSFRDDAIDSVRDACCQIYRVLAKLWTKFAFPGNDFPSFDAVAPLMKHWTIEGYPNIEV